MYLFYTRPGFLLKSQAALLNCSASHSPGSEIDIQTKTGQESTSPCLPLNTVVLERKVSSTVFL